MKKSFLGLFTMMLMAGVAPVRAQTDAVNVEPLVPSEIDNPAADAVDEELAYFLIDALQARENLEAVQENSQAQKLWVAAANLAESIQNADKTARPKFLPVLANLRAGFRDPIYDRDAIIQSMNLLTAIQNSPGIFPGGRNPISIEIHAIRDSTPVSGLYVWIDLVCCFSANTTSNALGSVTSPANASVIPGLYLIRLRENGMTVSEREVLIGGSGQSERIDMVVP